ncbi:MAG: ribonuclease D [Rhodospirillaceae bacterium]
MTLITTTDALKDYCASVKNERYITFDTEFIRERTYWPVLCLLQIGGPDDAVAVDTLADGIDLSPVYDLLRDPKILKVLHAARQDMEIFCRAMGECPGPIFDTQVAAMVCGFGDSVGYETLVSKLARKSIDKSSRFTDWSARPLSEKQLTYALSDVTHLRTVYEKLSGMLEKNNRADWVAAEMEALQSMDFYITDPQEAFERIKIRKPSPRVLAVLREAAAWRETEAQRADVPRNRILRDEALVEIAHHPPKTVEQVARIRGFSAKMAEGWQGKQVIEAVGRALDLPEGECPRPREQIVLPHGIGPVADLLKVLLKMCAEDSGVAQRLIATADEIDHIAAFGKDAQVPALGGWRGKVFGELALKLRSGDIGLAMNGNRIEIIEVDEVDGA